MKKKQTSDLHWSLSSLFIRKPFNYSQNVTVSTYLSKSYVLFTEAQCLHVYYMYFLFWLLNEKSQHIHSWTTVDLHYLTSTLFQCTCFSIKSQVLLAWLLSWISQIWSRFPLWVWVNNRIEKVVICHSRGGTCTSAYIWPQSMLLIHWHQAGLCHAMAYTSLHSNIGFQPAGCSSIAAL